MGKITFEQAKEAFLHQVNAVESSLDELKSSKLFFGAESVQDLLDFGRQDNEMIYPILELLGDVMSATNRYRSGLCGYLIGVYAENGFVVEAADRKLMQCFCISVKECSKLLERYCAAHKIQMQDLLKEEDAYPLDIDSMLAEHRQAVHSWYAMPLLALAVMSRISCQRALRDLLRQDAELCGICEMLNAFLDNVGFVPTVLHMVEDETALFLHPEKKMGYEVRMQEIDSNFLMFTLFQYTLYHAGQLEAIGIKNYAYNPLVEKVALHIPLEEGEPFPQPLSDKSCFGYHPYTAWQADGAMPEGNLVWGEGTLYEVPKINGRFVILLDTPRIMRNWSNAFIASTHSGLRPRLTIERTLAPDEVQSWMDAIALH